MTVTCVTIRTDGSAKPRVCARYVKKHVNDITFISAKKEQEH